MDAYDEISRTCFFMNDLRKARFFYKRGCDWISEERGSEIRVLGEGKTAASIKQHSGV